MRSMVLDLGDIKLVFRMQAETAVNSNKGYIVLCAGRDNIK